MISVLLGVALFVAGCSGTSRYLRDGRRAQVRLVTDPALIYPIVRNGRRYWNFRGVLQESAGVGYRVLRGFLKFFDLHGRVMYSSIVRVRGLTDGRHLAGDSQTPFFWSNWSSNPGLNKMCFIFYIEDDRRHSSRIDECLRFSKVPEPYVQHNRYILPLRGRLKVTCGNAGCRTHYISYQKYAWDFILLDDKMESRHGDRSRLKSYYSYGAKVLAPADGVVLRVRTGKPDNSIGTRKDYGNEVAIDHGNGEVSTFEHLRAGSIRVKRGQRVRQGQMIAELGNSGNSAQPHLHFSIKRKPDFRSLPVLLSSYYVLRNGHFVYVERGRPDTGEILISAPNGLAAIVK
ncbi:MAG: M23 family metallopeptidase [Myxococcales bacterium]|nr:M23 family metallopeptidase [Myxococcales bacterium]